MSLRIMSYKCCSMYTHDLPDTPALALRDHVHISSKSLMPMLQLTNFNVYSEQC